MSTWIVGSYTYLNTCLTWRTVLLYGGIGFLTIYLLYKILWEKYYSPLNVIPSRPRGHIFYGNMGEYFRGENMDIYTDWMKEMGSGIIRYYHCMGQSRVMIADADAMKRIMVTNSNNYIRPSYVREVLTRGIGVNLLFMNGEEHLVHRRLCSQAFKAPILQRMIPAMQGHSQQLVDRWKGLIEVHGNVRLNVADDLSRLASDTIASCGFGINMDSLNQPEEAVTSAFNNVSKYKPGILRFLFPALSMTIPTTANNKFYKNLNLCDGIIKDAIDKKRRQLENNQLGEDQLTDILSVLLQARDDETGNTLSTKQLRDHAMFFFAAGIQNTATCMSWCLLTLAQKPKIQERLRSEINTHLPAEGEPVTYEHLHNMKYLTATIKETLRFYPVISNFAKEAIKDDVINGYRIPAGTIVTLCVDALQKNPNYWENPEEFQPERFLDDKQTNHAWVPFGAGSKMCLGYKFAMNEMKIVLAMLIRRLHFRVIPDIKYRKKKCITMYPDPALELMADIILEHDI